MIKLDNVEIKPTIFPDGTSQVWKLPEDLLERLYAKGQATITWDFRKESELIHIAQLKDLLDTYNILVDLNVPYLPYARQDKRVSNESTFALRTFAKLINAMSFSRVITFDVHSDKTRTLIPALRNYEPYMEIDSARGMCGADELLFPDAGAFNRYAPLFGKWGRTMPCATKDRDPKTGYITNVQIQGDVKDKSILIVDDLCDAGGTFILVAKAAYEKGAKEVHLYVTHGLFTKGVKRLTDAGIKRIFTYGGEVG